MSMIRSADEWGRDRRRPLWRRRGRVLMSALEVSVAAATGRVEQSAMDDLRGQVVAHLDETDPFRRHVLSLYAHWPAVRYQPDEVMREGKRLADAIQAAQRPACRARVDLDG